MAMGSSVDDDNRPDYCSVAFDNLSYTIRNGNVFVVFFSGGVVFLFVRLFDGLLWCLRPITCFACHDSARV